MKVLFIIVLLLPLLGNSLKSEAQQSIQSDTVILNILTEINADSISATIQALQDFGTRFATANNRKDVALWIRDKFISIGYANAFLDSFLVIFNSDTTIQYNVVATLAGTTNPEIIYIAGAHQDSFNSNSTVSMTLAPGADDNASGVAATIEIARVLKQNNFQPFSSIRFITFAYEEGPGAGSEYYANKADSLNEDLRMMINCDMISYAPSAAPWTIVVNEYKNSKWVSDLAKYIINNFTLLGISEIENNLIKTDSYFFYKHGFKSIYLEEYDTNPFYHSAGDTLGNYNMPYCAEITKVACGMLLHEQYHPEVVNLEAFQSVNDIKVRWNKSKEVNVYGYNIYRSENPDSGFVKLNSNVLSLNDTLYTDPSPVPLSYFYYAVTTVDSSMSDGGIFNIDSAMVLTLDQGILIVDDSELEILSPSDSLVDIFYNSLLNEYSPDNFDIINSGSISLSEIGRYSTVVWHTDKFGSHTKFLDSEFILGKYLKSGGNLLFTCDRFSRITHPQAGAAMKYNEETFNHDYLLCDSMNIYSGTCRFSGALPEKTGYPALKVDSIKADFNFGYNLTNIEEIIGLNNCTEIYSYDSYYPVNNNYGKMKGKSVGYEYIGNDYKLVILSFPLWYMKYDSAKAFMDHVMTNVFNEGLSVDETSLNKTVTVSCYPNPSSGNISIKFNLNHAGKVKITVIDITGNTVKEFSCMQMYSGIHKQEIDCSDLKNGIYFITLTTEEGSSTAKAVLLK